MRLSEGSRLGPYEILAPLGAGGMGEVYRARDSRLDRQVAVKILLSDLAGRPELRQRFEREARAASRLDHPHICTVFDLGHHEGIDYLVMEYLEGESLSKRLTRGPLPLAQALTYAVQIADALAEAHRHHIVHRDLKPANIMLARSGVKILDFGLAKFRPTPEASVTRTVQATETDSSLTGQGTIMGTVQYMAPEQLEGRDADGRSDLFAFGAVLYEMITGRRAFTGKSQASLIAAILTSEPPPISTISTHRLEPAAAELQWVVARCLAKDPEERWQTAKDLASELRRIAEEPAGPAAAAQGRKRRTRAPWAWIAAVVVLAALSSWLYLTGARAAAPTVRFTVPSPEKSALGGGAAISPDGQQLAFITTRPDGTSSLWVRALDTLRARPLAGTEGAAHPFWSPDSRYLGFFAQGKLRKIQVSEGPPQALCDVFDARGGTWNRKGTIVFSPNVGDRLYQISESGAGVRPVTTLDASRQESSHQWPQFLPDGRHFLFLVWSEQAAARGVYVGSLDGPERKRLLAVDWGVAYAPAGRSGFLLFPQGQTLMARPFSPSSLALSGEPFPVGEDAWYDETTPGLCAVSASANGSLAYRSGPVRRTQLVWFSRAGQLLSPVGPPGAYGDPTLSPDGKSVAVSRMNPQTGTHDIWVFDLARGTGSRLTFHPSEDVFPLWSPDGSRVVFASNRNGAPDLFQKAVAGDSGEEILMRSPMSKYPTGWSRDGRHIVFANWSPKSKWDLWVLPTAGGAAATHYLETDFDSFQADFSPDGHWIAYTSNESGRYEVYVRPFPAAGGKQMISANGGAQPHWREDGRELYYLAPDLRLMAVDIRPGPPQEAGDPHALFQLNVTGLVDARNHFVPSRDGQRFLVNALAEDGSASGITVALNWMKQLGR